MQDRFGGLFLRRKGFNAILASLLSPQSALQTAPQNPSQVGFAPFGVGANCFAIPLNIKGSWQTGRSEV